MCHPCSAGAHDDPSHVRFCIPEQHPYCGADDPHLDLLGKEVSSAGAGHCRACQSKCQSRFAALDMSALADITPCEGTNQTAHAMVALCRHRECIQPVHKPSKVVTSRNCIESAIPESAWSCQPTWCAEPQPVQHSVTHSRSYKQLSQQPHPLHTAGAASAQRSSSSPCPLPLCWEAPAH
jgi:hypothetical protein